MTPEQALNEFTESEAILKGHFVLSSGLHSDTYMQCARVLSEPPRAEKLCKALAEKVQAKLGDVKIDLVVSPAMGGVVVGYEMGRQLGVPAIFCEREEGRFTLRRGFRIEPGQKVLLVEDVVTTGKSSLETVRCITEHGGEIVAEAALVDRSSGIHDLPFPFIPLITLEVQTFPPDKIPESLKDVAPVKPGSRWLKTEETAA